MSLFKGSWYFGGQFFEDAAVRIDTIATHDDELRSSGRFPLDEEDDEQIVAALELQRRGR